VSTSTFPRHRKTSPPARRRTVGARIPTGRSTLGHEFVQAGRVKVRRQCDAAFLVDGVDHPVERCGGLDGDGKEDDVVDHDYAVAIRDCNHGACRRGQTCCGNRGSRSGTGGYGLDHDPEPTFTLEVDSDGCGVVRSGEIGDDVTWVINDQDGFQVLARNAAGETQYRYSQAGTYTVVLQAWGGRYYVAVSNEVTITC